MDFSTFKKIVGHLPTMPYDTILVSHNGRRLFRVRNLKKVSLLKLLREQLGATPTAEEIDSLAEQLKQELAKRGPIGRPKKTQ
jgi:hypothetical protein